jgi:hypothetical protein
VRIALVAVAVLVAAWFALGVRQAHDTSRAMAIVSAGRPSPAQAKHASELLNAAAFLNPDHQVDVLRARLDLVRGDEPAARALLKRVVAGERFYLDAWIWLARASVGDLRDFYAAAYRIRQLVPPVH